MTATPLPSWATPSWKLAIAPLPQPGPVRASERIKFRQARRPSLMPDKMKRVRKELLNKYGAEYWRKQLRKSEVRRSLKEFIKEFWEVIEPGTPLVWNWHIDVLCEVLERVTARDPEYRRVLINIPPGHMKSVIVSIMWPAWQWLENPGYRGLFVTYVQTLTNDHARKCRDLVQSKKYKEFIPRLYGEKWDEAWTLRRDYNGIEGFGTTLGGDRKATSVDGAGTGLRGDDIVIDDPMNADEFPTPESLDDINNWYDKRMSSRFNDMTTGAIVIIMQRLHENDLSGHVLAQDEANKNKPGWIKFRHVCLPSEFDPDNASEFDRRTFKGELLFAARFTRIVIENAKIQLGAQFSAQHDQRPVAASGGIFPMWKICFWYPAGVEVPMPHREKDESNNYVPCKQGVLPGKFDTQIQSWDMAFKDLKTSDYVCGGLLARKGSSCYLIDITHGHLSFSASCDAVRVMSANYPLAIAKYVEDKANGPAVIDALKEEIMGLEEVNPDGGKVARAWAVEPMIKAGNVWLPHPALYPETHKILGEMRPFPKVKHDDRVDMLTQGLRKLATSIVSLLKAMTKT